MVRDAPRDDGPQAGTASAPERISGISMELLRNRRVKKTREFVAALNASV